MTTRSTRCFVSAICLHFAITLLTLASAQAQQFLPPTPGGRGIDVADANKVSLLKYRRMFRQGVTPSPAELSGQWRGSNKGIVEIAGYRQFIKDIRPDGQGGYYGDNIQVQPATRPGQLQLDLWEPKFDARTGDYERRGRFAVQPPTGIGYFGHGTVLSYRDGGNPPRDPSRLLQDQVVRINDHQMLGRATAKFGPIKIPLAYFVIERIE